MWNSLRAVFHSLAIEVEGQSHVQKKVLCERPTPNPAMTQHQNSSPGGLRKRSPTQLINLPTSLWVGKTSQPFLLCCTQGSMDLKQLLHQPGSCWYGWRDIAEHLLINFHPAFSSCLRINLISLMKAIRIKKPDGYLWSTQFFQAPAAKALLRLSLRHFPLLGIILQFIQ